MAEYSTLASLSKMGIYCIIAQNMNNLTSYFQSWHNQDSINVTRVYSLFPYLLWALLFFSRGLPLWCPSGSCSPLFCPSEPVGKDPYLDNSKKPRIGFGSNWPNLGCAHPWFIHYCEKWGRSMQCSDTPGSVYKPQLAGGWVSCNGMIMKGKKRGIEGISPHRKAEQMNA